jgi:SAM-dependent methyltransferase
MTGTRIDSDAFRNFERDTHGRIAGSYSDLFTAVTDRAIEPLIVAVGVRHGTRLLDAAAGPGRLTRAAAERGALATGCDLAPDMVALARQLNPGLAFDEASADALPYADASYDAVACAFGVGHFPEPERVIAEFARVLTPGGRTALSWWDDFARNRINGIFHEVTASFGVSAPGKVPQGPPMDRYSNRSVFAELLTSAGFGDVHVEAVRFTHRLRDVDEFWQLAMGSFARASSIILAQSQEKQRSIRAGVAEAARPYLKADGLHIPTAFLLASGTRLAMP